MIDFGLAIAQAARSLIGQGYIMGATGWICTQRRIEQQAAQYPAYADKIYKYGPKWMGKKCYDCAQLTRTCAKAAGITLPSGATSQWNANVWAEKGTMDTFPANEPGILLFWRNSAKANHVSISLGDGTEVEARGHAYGVMRRSIADISATHWARLRYGTSSDASPAIGEGDPAQVYTTLRQGARGDKVTTMQHLLLAWGCALPLYGVDGHFGRETLAALKRFQRLQGLTADGVCGMATWTALYADPPQETPEDAPSTYTVTIAGLDAAECTYLLETYGAKATAVESGVGKS